VGVPAHLGLSDGLKVLGLSWAGRTETLVMELAGLEPATSWVRSRRSLPEFGFTRGFPSLPSVPPTSSPKFLQAFLLGQRLRTRHEAEITLRRSSARHDPREKSELLLPAGSRAG
jgi:hypothetical protein